MGPITLFDKSFLQSLSVDESVWFDCFFLPNICPMFYVETLADLGKTKSSRGTPEAEVARIADKFPDMGGKPCIHHQQLCVGNLMGHSLPLTGRIPVAGGKPVKSGEGVGYIYDQSPEAEAFSRWSNHEFLDVERKFASVWRSSLENLDLKSMAEAFSALGITGQNCRSLEDARNIANSIINSSAKPYDQIKLAAVFLEIPQHLVPEIIRNWQISGFQPLSRYAPYAAYVLEVEIFFQIALAASLISTERASNRMDISYLYYLPFCSLFVSGDKLHKKTVPLFARKNQEFVWGPSLKKSLNEIDGYYASLPEEIKERGIMSFAGTPPQDFDTLVANLWDRHANTNWRKRSAVLPAREKTGGDAKLLDKVHSMTRAPSLSSEELASLPTEPESVSFKYKIRKRKGSWYQLDKNMEILESDFE